MLYMYEVENEIKNQTGSEREKRDRIYSIGATNFSGRVRGQKVRQANHAKGKLPTERKWIAVAESLECAGKVWSWPEKFGQRLCSRPAFLSQA